MLLIYLYVPNDDEIRDKSQIHDAPIKFWLVKCSTSNVELYWHWDTLYVQYPFWHEATFSYAKPAKKCGELNHQLCPLFLYRGWNCYRRFGESEALLPNFKAISLGSVQKCNLFTKPSAKVSNSVPLACWAEVRQCRLRHNSQSRPARCLLSFFLRKQGRKERSPTLPQSCKYTKHWLGWSRSAISVIIWLKCNSNFTKVGAVPTMF